MNSKMYLFTAAAKVKLLTVPWLIGLSLLQGCGSSGEGANPGTFDIPIAYVKRTIPLDEDGIPEDVDIREPLQFSPGGDVYVKAYSAVSASEINITHAVTGGTGDVRDVESSYDGTRIIFSLRLEDPNPNDNDIPKWTIYEYNLLSAELRAIQPGTAIAGNDIAPYYLPDGRIVFSSDRQIDSRAILLDEGQSGGISKPQFSSLDERRVTKALVLHVMNSDGSDIHQISFNQSHDLDPVVMPNGRILFTRWDEAGVRGAFNLYTITPDGGDVQMYYGTDPRSHVDANGDSIQFTQPRVMQDGRIVTLARPFEGTYGGGDLLIIDGENYIDINQPTFTNQGILSGPAQVKATVAQVNNGGLSTAGRYLSAFPLQDGSNRLLVSKGSCQLTVDDIQNPDIEIVVRPCIEPYLSDPDVVEMPPSYGIWIYDLNTDTERPLITADAGYIISDVTVAQPQDEPLIIPDKAYSELDQNLKAEGTGLLHIRSVYDFGSGTFNGCFLSVCSSASVNSVTQLADPALATADQRPARFIRLVKSVGIPQRNDPDLTSPPNIRGTAFGRTGVLGMREIIGYGMVEPDGSVLMKVPANVAFGVEVLDKSGRRMGSRHENWLQVKAGDTLECNGCHVYPGGQNASLPLPHGRRDAEAPSIHAGVPYDAIEGYVFPNTLNPDTLGEYFAEYGETMAQARVRQAINSTLPSVNLEYVDVWTDPLVRAPDAAFSYTYNGVDGLSTAIPTSNTCLTAWAPGCRIVINYEDHIQPIWEVDRGANTCTSCHNTRDALNTVQVPAAQLDLTSGTSDEEVDHIESYRELLFNDEAKALDNTGNLVDLRIEVPVLDGNGQPVVDEEGNTVTEIIFNPAVPSPQDIPDPVASMSTNGARVSYFMEKMTETEIQAGRILPTPTVNHAGMLTPAELRLISEWLDLGAQYYNNPFF